EAQRAARLQKELREERQQEEMARLNAAVTKRPINKLEWMYNAPATGAPRSTEDLEAYLLGKRDAAELVAPEPAAEAIRKPDDKWKDGLFAFSNRNANSERDAMAKAAEDPLAEIHRREQAAAQAAARQPAAGRSRDEPPPRGKDRERKEERRHRHKHRSGRGSEQSPRRSRSRERHGERRHRHRHGHSGSGSRRRSRSPTKP
ncbi:RNA-splicing factor, partial [Coemansia helicoidea]